MRWGMGSSGGVEPTRTFVSGGGSTGTEAVAPIPNRLSSPEEQELYDLLAPAAGPDEIGRIGLLRHHDWPVVEEPVEVGWVLHRDYWGRGLATEGARASVDAWRRHLLGDDVVYSFTIPRNVRSRAVMERLGMEYGGSAVWRQLEHVWYFLSRE